MKGETHISSLLNEVERVHVDSFIDDPTQDAYARWMFMHFRLPAWQKASFEPFIKERKLFCTYEGKRFRVTGASTMGDVWLVRDFKRDHGYDLRVVVYDCKDWSPRE
jgi:hypothetical protein